MKTTIATLIVLLATASHAFERGDISMTAERLMARTEAKLEQSAKPTTDLNQKTNESLCKHHDSKESGCC